MKSSIVLLLLATAAFAQEPPPAASFEGTVSQLLLNPDGDIDGLLLADGVQVKFPPHLGGELSNAVKANDKVSIQGQRESEKVVRADTVTISASGVTVKDAPPVPRVATRKALQAEGKVRATLSAPRGEPEGAVLEDGSIVRMPPHLARPFAALLQVGSAISVRGFGTENDFGRSLEVTEIAAAGQPLQPVFGARPPQP